MTHQQKDRDVDVHAVVLPSLHFAISTRNTSIMRILLALLAMSSRGVLGFAPLTQPPRPLTPSQSLVPLFMAADEIEEIYMDTEDRMSKSIESVKKNLNTIRTGRANPNMLDRVTCDYYGVPTPLNQMSSISVPSSQQLQISPFDKSQLTNIQKAIVEADLGLSANNDGTVIRINIPELTEDRRKEMIKQCKSIGEEGKVAIRNVRRDGVDAIKKLEKAKTVGEDEMLDGVEAIQKMTDKSTKEIDDIVSKKEKEVMTV